MSSLPCCCVARGWLAACLHRLPSFLLLLMIRRPLSQRFPALGASGLAHPASPKAHFLMSFLGARIWTGYGQDILPSSTVLAPASILGCRLSEGRGRTIKPALPQQLTHWGNWFCGSILQMNRGSDRFSFGSLLLGEIPTSAAHWRGFARTLLSGSL